MRIWLFTPSPGMSYFGGMAAVVAPTFERAAELVKAQEGEDDSRVYQALTDVPDLVAKTFVRDFWGTTWVLSSSYELADPNTPESCLINSHEG